MESIRVDLSPPIAVGATADIHDWSAGRVLKLYRADVPRSACVREAKITRLLHAAGVRVPIVGEVVEVNGRLGLPMEKLLGPTFGALLRRSEPADRLGRIAAEIHVAMHALAAPNLQTMRVQFRWVIERGPLSTETKARVLGAMEALPDGDRICHGDFHLENIVMTVDGPVVIDCPVAHQGNPQADVAQTDVITKELLARGLPEPAARTVDRFMSSYRERYDDLSPDGHDQVVAWRPIVAAVRLSMGAAQAGHSERLERIVDEGPW